MRIHFTAAEASGDLLGREVIEALRLKAPEMEIAGIGGTEMAAVGVSSSIDLSPLSVIGIVEGIRAYGDVKRLVGEVADAIIAYQPDAAVLIDSWGFTIRLAKELRRRAPHIRLVKLVGPQVWASRPGRAKKIAANYDHLLAISPMELPHYEGTGLTPTVIGAPAMSRSYTGDGPEFRDSHAIAADAPLLLVLPGSRPSEIRRVAPVLVAAAERCKAAVPALEVVATPATGVSEAFRAQFGALDWLRTVDAGDRRYDAMAAADVALACSGTVTSEVAIQGTALVVGYKLGWITWAILRSGLYRRKTITMLNIAAGDQQIAPEFIQLDFTPEKLATAVLARLENPDLATSQVAAQTEALGLMGFGGRPAAEVAAEAILGDLA
ncbi:MAG: lipid-A-disaccharide synthase [Pseudomonadota bacterium]